MSSERWEFGTVVRHDSVSEELTAMVVFDHGARANGYCEIDLISLSGRIADESGLLGHYGYGKVWRWNMTRRWWTVVSEP